MKPLILLALLLLGSGGSGFGDLTDDERKKRFYANKKAKPGDTVVDGKPVDSTDAMIINSDWFENAMSDVSYLRSKVDSVDGLVSTVALLYGVAPSTLVKYYAIKAMSHVIFPDEGEDRLETLLDSVATGTFEAVFGKGVKK